jgi:hypothetical protein
MMDPFLYWTSRGIYGGVDQWKVQAQAQVQAQVQVQVPRWRVSGPFFRCTSAAAGIKSLLGSHAKIVLDAWLAAATSTVKGTLVLLLPFLID